eukprot:9302319-Alexandrium_andersonii.AAC.1
MTAKRAPGPGAMKKTDWAPWASTHLNDRRVVLHTDSARSYRMHVPGMLHDAVVHKKKRVLVNGRYKWLRP